MTTSIIAIIISFASLCFAVWIGLKGTKRTDVKDIEERAKENARINYKLDEITSNTRDIKNDITSIANDVRQHNDRLIIVEQSCKSAHKRLDLLEKHLGKGDVE